MKWKVYTRERDIVTRGYVVWHKILSVTNYIKCTYKYIVQIFYYLYNKHLTGPGLLLLIPWILFQAVQVVSPIPGLPCWSSWSPYVVLLLLSVLLLPPCYTTWQCILYDLYHTYIVFYFTGDMLFIQLLSQSLHWVSLLVWVPPGLTYCEPELLLIISCYLSRTHHFLVFLFW